MPMTGCGIPSAGAGATGGASASVAGGASESVLCQYYTPDSAKMM